MLFNILYFNILHFNIFLEFYDFFKMEVEKQKS